MPCLVAKARIRYSNLGPISHRFLDMQGRITRYAKYAMAWGPSAKGTP